eukprot:7396620-Lingulodinium_polyedra.AAC.1
MVAIVCGAGCGDLSGSLVVKLVHVTLLGGCEEYQPHSRVALKSHNACLCQTRAHPDKTMR